MDIWKLKLVITMFYVNEERDINGFSGMEALFYAVENNNEDAAEFVTTIQTKN